MKYVAKKKKNNPKKSQLLKIYFSNLENVILNIDF
jgi:hypothetical protein